MRSKRPSINVTDIQMSGLSPEKPDIEERITLGMSAMEKRHERRLTEKFKHSEPSREELRHYRLEIVAYIFLALYFIVLVLLIWHFSQSYLYDDQWTTPVNWTLGYLLLVASNLLLLYPLGSLVIRAIVFPYSFWGAERYIVGEG